MILFAPSKDGIYHCAIENGLCCPVTIGMRDFSLPMFPACLIRLVFRFRNVGIGPLYVYKRRKFLLGHPHAEDINRRTHRACS